MIGQNIHNYKILSQIGEGGMGQVYLAEHISLGRKVAIKVLLHEYAQNYEIKNRFINEAKTLSKLTNIFIVTLYDFAEIDGRLFLIMEYVQGEQLNKLIEEKKLTSVEKILNIFTNILNGFNYAHNSGIIHRDIKPSNIIIQNDDTPKILDFGIAKIIQGDVHLTRTGTKMGTVLYMSPEQVLGYDVDYRSDIYSLGIVLYEMLTNKSPYSYNTESDYEIMNCIVQQEIPELILKEDIGLGNIIRKACSKNPEDRYQNLSEFIDDIKRIKNKSDNILINEIKTNPIQTNKTTVINQSNNLKSTPDKKSYNTIIIIASVVTILIAVFIVFISVKDNIPLQEKNNVIITKDTNKPKEDTVISQIRNLTLGLLKDTESKSSEISKYYAERVNYYKSGFYSLSNILKDKYNFFNKWDNITLTPYELIVNKLAEDKYECIYDKYFKASKSSGKFYEGKVKSKLVYEKISDIWLITTETDDYIYWTNKN